MINKENLVLVEVTIKDGELQRVQAYEGDEQERRFASSGWCKPKRNVIVHTLPITVTKKRKK
jgi:hypothetical protein